MNNLNINMDFTKDKLKIEFISLITFDDNLNSLSDALVSLSDYIKEDVKSICVYVDKITDAQKIIIKSVIYKSFENINVVFVDKLKTQKEYFDGVKKGDTVFYKGTIRSGQNIISKSNLVIVGDVNRGAQIEAAGNIVVFGSLSGIAFAGQGGNEDAFVLANNLKPVQIKIGDKLSRIPDEMPGEENYPEIATVESDRIVIKKLEKNLY